MLRLKLTPLQYTAVLHPTFTNSRGVTSQGHGTASAAFSLWRYVALISVVYGWLDRDTPHIRLEHRNMTRSPICNLWYKYLVPQTYGNSPVSSRLR